MPSACRCCSRCSNFQGFGKELFTDAGKYVVHFGSSPTEAAEQVATAVQVGGWTERVRCGMAGFGQQAHSGR